MPQREKKGSKVASKKAQGRGRAGSAYSPTAPRKPKKNRQKNAKIGDAYPVGLDQQPNPDQELTQNFTAVIQDKNVSTPKDIYLDDFSIYAHQCQLFLNSNLHLPFGTKAGLIGRNGQGKTTLLRHLAERQLPIHPRMDILYVEQEVAPTDLNPVETVLSANQERFQLIKKFKELEAQLEHDDKNNEHNEHNQELDDQLLTEYQEVADQLVAIQADRDEPYVKKLLIGLGFSISDQTKPVKEFSGGWRMRISLARALYLKPTVLLLDEPTNHLDLNATIWLTDYLADQWQNSLLVVSHNQDFLNQVCDQILHIEDRQLHSYRGNYDSFTRSHQRELQKQQKDWDKVQKRIKEMRKKGTPKPEVMHYLQTCGVDPPQKPYEPHFRFPTIADPTSFTSALEVYGVSFGYEEEKPLFQGLEFGIDLQTRAVIVGPNGVGKSTLIKLLTGEIEPLKGEIRRNRLLRVGYYNQHFVDFLPLAQSPVDYLKSISKLTAEELAPNPTQRYRTILGGVGLKGSTHLMPIGKLSGGQKARVAFCALSVQKPQVIFLDEPTNHLDIESINGLIDGIKEFNGGVVMISHDVQLITKTNAQLWVVKDRQVSPHPKGYAGYKEEILADLD